MIELQRQFHDDEDTEILARIGYRYLEFLAGKSSYAVLVTDVEPLVTKYFDCGLVYGFEDRLDEDN